MATPTLGPAPIFDGSPTSPTGLRLPEDSILMIPHCRVTGGKRTSAIKVREDEEGNRLETEKQVTTTIDDVEERKRAEALASEGVYQVRRLSHSTPIGYVTRREILPQIDQGLDALRARVATFNGGSQFCKVSVGYLAIPLSIDLGPSVARALAEHVRDALERVRGAVQAGGAGLPAAMLGAKNADQLATGMLREAIAMALDQAREAGREISAQVKRGVSPASAGALADVSLIDAAIGMLGI